LSRVTGDALIFRAIITQQRVRVQLTALSLSATILLPPTNPAVSTIYYATTAYAALIAVRPRQQEVQIPDSWGDSSISCDALRIARRATFVVQDDKMTEPLISLKNLSFRYKQQSQPDIEALYRINLNIRRGEYIAILGHNGSGKSTLARHLNALLLPAEGRVVVNGWDTRDPEHTLDVRRTVGMVFQVPDDQIVGTVVQEDVAFGPENLGLPREGLQERVRWALETVGLWELRKQPTHLLAGGQKQLLAVAGMLALRPACLVLDEATALLDGQGRATILSTLAKLHRRGLTIIAITHLVEEASAADRVIVLERGHVVLDDTPRRAFSDPERLRELRLDVPEVADLAQRLHRHNRRIPPDCLEPVELSEAILRAARRRS